MTTSDPAQWPLGGLRVLELATGVAGPYAGKLVCDAGAEVVKLEEPGGDPLRGFTACARALAPGEDGTLFRFLNASKRSAVADMTSAAGRRFVLDLAARSDLVIESFAAGGLERRCLSVSLLREQNPGLSVVSLSPWGLSGPWCERPATEFTHQARCGSSPRRGLPDRTPVAVGGQLGDFAAGVYAACGGLAAWLAARRTGEGQHVDVSLFEVVTSVLTTYFGLRGHWLREPIAFQAEAPSIEPARDGWVGFCTYTAQQWLDFCALIARPDLAAEKRFLHNSERFKNRDFLQQRIHPWTRARSVAEIVELAGMMRVPCAPVLDARGVLACEHFTARGVFVANPHGFRQPRVPYRLGGGTTRPVGRAPSLGEHTAEVRTLLERPRPPLPRAAGRSALPLDGVRVIDLTAFWAGPVATSFLSDMGADVIKIESIQRPDGMRFVGVTGNQPHWEWSEVFHGANPGKRSVTLNLDTEEGRELLLRLVERADVVAENASPRVFENFGFTLARLQERNPRLVLLRMPAWGLDGPWRDRAGFAANVEQATGIAWLTGYEDAPLVAQGCDPIGGMHAAFALLLALEVVRRTGTGQLVETSLVEPALNVAAQQVMEWDAYGVLAARDENRGPVAAPQGMYRCRTPLDVRDPQWLAIAISDDAQWQSLRRGLGDPDWARAHTMQTVGGRRRAHDAIDAELATWCAGRLALEAEELLVAAGVPAAAGIDAHSLLPNPQLAHRGFFQEIEHPVTGRTPYPNLPMRFSKLGAGLHRSPPPTLGQHNDEVLGGELGLDRDELARLRALKIIGERPA